MSRPRKPTQLHLISGSLKASPKRFADRLNEPAFEGADLIDIPPPKSLDKAMAAIWNELRKQLHPRVASYHDSLAFECLVRLVYKIRTGNPTAADYARQQAFLGEFGMTPASRSRVSQAKSLEPKKGFAALRSKEPGGERPWDDDR